MSRIQRHLLILACLSHALCHAYMLIFPVVLGPIKQQYGFSFLGVGTVGMVAYFCFGLGAMPAGLLIDKVGPKRMLTIGLFGMALSSLAIGLTPSVAFMMLAMFALGCFASIHHPAALAMISMMKVERKGRAFGIHAVAGSIGIAAAPFITGAILSQLDWRYPYLLFALLGLMAAFFSLQLPVPEGLERRAPGSPKLDALPEQTAPGYAYQIFVALCGASALFGLIYRGTLTYFPTLFAQNGAALNGSHLWIGSLTGLILAFGAIGQFYGGVASDRLKTKAHGTLFIFVMSAPLLVGIGFTQGVTQLILCGLLSLLVFTFQPIQNHIIAEATKQRRRGVAYGVNYGLLFGFGSFAASVGGWGIDRFGVHAIYVCMGGVAILAAGAVAAQLILSHRSALAEVNLDPTPQQM
ncbi:MAG: hypothetical protein ETSY1_27480 [Candidatus Entotheonella factor]|uniref:Major facilitator superfamily (MFS) profile domain-containing protein n=1 Tax=Entotheonella factor TaxID=1429438 RepID=W4LEU7_ENTF1|nr:MAG: hypothetical protein ETSY1_27480 [Candidatus Entotheonella factor]